MYYAFALYNCYLRTQHDRLSKSVDVTSYTPRVGFLECKRQSTKINEEYHLSKKKKNEEYRSKQIL